MPLRIRTASCFFSLWLPCILYSKNDDNNNKVMQLLMEFLGYFQPYYRKGYVEYPQLLLPRRSGQSTQMEKEGCGQDGGKPEKHTPLPGSLCGSLAQPDQAGAAPVAGPVS